MNVLSISGGGVRGIIPLMILKEILTRASAVAGHTLQVPDLFDYCSGSSIGTLIVASLLLASSEGPEGSMKPKYSVDDMINQLVNGASTLFSTTFLQNVRTCWGWRAPKYLDDHRGSMFKNIFGDACMRQLIKPVVFPCGDELNDRPVYIHSQSSSHKDLAIVDVLLGTTAAPTYFPSHRVIIDGQESDLTDSGDVTNDTAMIAYAEVLHQCQQPDTIYELSIGTGNSKISYNAHYWGMFEWVQYIANLLIDFNMQNQEYELSLITQQSQADHLDVTIPANIFYMDQPQYIPQYQSLTQQWIQDNSKELDSVVAKLLANKGLPASK